MEILVSLFAGGPPRIVDLEVARLVLPCVMVILVHLAFIIQYNLFSLSHLVSFLRLASFLFSSAFHPLPNFRDLGPSLTLHIAHSPSYTTSLYVNYPHSISFRSLPLEIPSLRNDFGSLDHQTLKVTLRSSDRLRRSRSDSCGPSTAPDNVYLSDHNESYVPIEHPKSSSLRILQHPIRSLNDPQAGAIHQNRRDLHFKPSIHHSSYLGISPLV